jgi:DNA-binding NtrC family response regulator
LARGRLITPDDLRSSELKTEEGARDLAAGAVNESLALKPILAETERRVILQALEQTDWNRTQAAQVLQISRRQLFDKIRQYGLESRD